jgi:LacI family transcriptional regulator
MAKAVRLSDIAKRVGVSTVTVSKALSDQSGVSEEKREDIKTVAKKMGYVRSRSSKSSQNTGNIGVLIPNHFLAEGHSFYWAMYQQLVESMTQLGYYAILEILNHEEEENLQLPKMVLDQKIEGLIIMGQISEAYGEYMGQNNDVPIMLLDAYNDVQHLDAVISDGFYGMYALTNYLISQGHKKIGFLGTILATSSITDRYLGFMKAMMEHHLDINEAWIIPDRDLTYGNSIDIELPNDLPTAFTCNCDAVANMLIKKIEEKKLSVPQDISVVGFDNYLYPTITYRGITTYEVNMEGMATTCVNTLMDKIQNKPFVKGIQIVTGEMVLKESVRNISVQ